MSRKILLLFLLCVVLMFTACEQDLLKPGDYVPDNAVIKPTFNRSVLMSDTGSYDIGYRNYNIRPYHVTLNWAAETSVDFVCYKLYRDNMLLRTINSKNTTAYVDSLVMPDNYYKYTIATLVRTGLNKADTLTVKTPSIDSPELFYRITHDNRVRLSWIDNSEIPGGYNIYKDNVKIYTAPENVFTFTDSNVLSNSYYSYAVVKANPYDETESGWFSNPIRVNYVINAPTILSIERIIGTTQKVRLRVLDYSTGADAVKIYRRPVSQGVFAPVEFSVMGMSQDVNYPDFEIREFVDTRSFMEDISYEYYVTAFNTVNSEESDPSPTQVVEYNTYQYDFENQTFFPFTTFGDGMWGISASGYLSNYCVRSPQMESYQSSQLRLTVSVPQYTYIYVDFLYELSNQYYENSLTLNCNGSYAWNSWYNTNWYDQSVVYYSTSGNLTLDWIYSQFEQSGYAKLDNISISYYVDGKRVYVDLGGKK